MVSKIKKHELIENLLDAFPRPISEFADKLNISYCTAQRHLLNLVIEEKARMIEISGIRMYLKKIKGKKETN